MAVEDGGRDGTGEQPAPPAPTGPSTAPGPTPGAGGEQDVEQDVATVAGGLAALTATLDALLAAETWRCTDDEVRAAVVDLERQASRLDAVRLRLLSTAEERRVGRAAGAPSTADWLVGATTTRAEHARRRVDLAVALDTDLAPTRTALACGDLTGDHAGVIRTALLRLHPDVDPATRADAQAFLVEQARHLDPRQLARVGRHLTARLDPGADDDLARTEARQESQRQVRCTQTDDGAWLLSGVLDPVGGATLMAALEPLAAPRPAPDGTPDIRSHARRLADALLTVADAHLAGRTGSSSSRPRLLVTVPLATLLDPAAPGAAPGHLPGGHPVSGETAGLLACDAQLVPVLTTAEGQPLDVGRSVYAWPEAIRTAIRLRDQTCTFGSCTRPAEWCHVHHITEYSRGGSTSERNGTCLCGHHHRLVHRQGWRGELRGTQVVWHPPDSSDPHVPPPPWRERVDRVVHAWRRRAATPGEEDGHPRGRAA
ncbi:HNH endonuclease signature motif containing protein [uncultured Pseudokineococcus sp.]|uniref:HNH endonuclease signature motif containing protein n=1 Tax=uncultured Pseudokineococcus sp. TaxID=1642928 RepID=UPI002609CCD0|nr:HNH endonuclease signature motif containing protein [uncultured Pseudokineococcus sp.]